MLDTFLKVAYSRSQQAEENERIITLLQKLPAEELAKMAFSGEVAPISVKGADCNNTFLEQFKGTPLIEQAMALESEELQAEMADLQRRQERRLENKDTDLWDIKDGIRVKKKLLELELAKVNLGQMAGNALEAATPPPDPTQGAGAVGDVPVAPSSVGDKVASTALALRADAWGRELARSDYEKSASIELFESMGKAAGALMAKEALMPPGMSGMLSGVGKAALGFAKANPAAAIGAGVGAVGGAAAGARQGGVAGALGGGLLGGAGGAALGAGGAGMAGRMQAGMGVGGALQGTARAGMAHLQKLPGMMGA